MAPATLPEPVERSLAYAGPGVRTAPRRTVLRIVARWAWNGVRWIVRLVQALLVGGGYLVLGAAMVVHVLLVAVATGLLFLGRLRWNGHAVRVWGVRTFNRARLRVARPFRRRSADVPLAAAHATGSAPS